MLTAAILLIVKTVIIPAFGAAATWLIAEATKWVRAKTGSETAATSLMVLDDVIGVVVKEMQVTRTNPAKAAAQGSLSAQVASDIKAEAVDKVKGYLGTDGMNKMVAAMNLDADKAVAIIESKIEAAVFHTRTPAQQPAASQPDVRLPPPPMPSASTQNFAPSDIEVLTRPPTTPAAPAAPAPPMAVGPQIAAPLPPPPAAADAPPLPYLHPAPGGK